MIDLNNHNWTEVSDMPQLTSFRMPTQLCANCGIVRWFHGDGTATYSDYSDIACEETQVSRILDE